MTPAGYLLKRVVPAPPWVCARPGASVCSLSGCVSEAFANYVPKWRHNGYWLFDRPEIALEIAAEDGIDASGLALFYYEVHEQQFVEDRRAWQTFAPNDAFPTNVIRPAGFERLGWDVVTFSSNASPECSPLTCCGLAGAADANDFCLLASDEDARSKLESGFFDGSEPGPFRIFSVWRAPASPPLAAR
jgi:hypothetical protein